MKLTWSSHVAVDLLSASLRTVASREREHRNGTPDLRDANPRSGEERMRGGGMAFLDGSSQGCMNRRMPRMQVYLPDDLYAAVKKRRLPASELLQNAVRAELRRLDLLAETDRYLADLVSQVGEPSPSERARAKAVAQRIAKRTTRKAS